MKWTKGNFTVQVNHNPERVYGYSSGCWGISSHSGTSSAYVWILYHLPTGMYARGFNRMKDAKQFAESLDPLADWSVSLIDREHHEAFRQVRRLHPAL